MLSRLSLPAGLVVLTLAGACSDRTPLPTQLSHLPSASTARSVSGSTSNTAVTSTIADDDATIAPALQIRSDGAGPYVNSSNLISVIQSVGDWQMDSYSPRGSTRTVYLDFSQPIAGSGPNGADPQAIPSGLYKVNLISKCHLYNQSFFTIAPGTTVACPLHVGQIYVGTNQYAVQMNPQLSSADTAWTETNYANVTCTAGTTACTQWTITPSGMAADGSASNVAALLYYATSGTKGKTTTTIIKQGDYRMSFRLSVSNP